MSLGNCSCLPFSLSTLPRPEGTWETYSFKLNYFLEDRTELNWVSGCICCAQLFPLYRQRPPGVLLGSVLPGSPIITPYQWPFLSMLDLGTEEHPVFLHRAGHRSRVWSVWSPPPGPRLQVWCISCPTPVCSRCASDSGVLQTGNLRSGEIWCLLERQALESDATGT